MAEFSRSDSVDELFANFSEEQYARAQDLMERRARETAPGETTPAPSARMGMFLPTAAPELRGRKNLAMFLGRFYTLASATGCDSALDSEVVIKTSGTPRAELERLYNRALVDKSLRVWQSLTKALEKGILEGLQKPSTFKPGTLVRECRFLYRREGEEQKN